MRESGRKAAISVGARGSPAIGSFRTWSRPRAKLDAEGDRSILGLTREGRLARRGSFDLAATATGPSAEPRTLLRALEDGFRRVDREAARNGPDDAASELTTVYMTEFEPLELYLLARSPQEVRGLEIQFNTLRGDLAAGLKGEELAARLDGLSTEVETLIARLEAQPAGRRLRAGVFLVAHHDPARGDRGHPDRDHAAGTGGQGHRRIGDADRSGQRTCRSVGRARRVGNGGHGGFGCASEGAGGASDLVGVALAAAASVATAVALNRLVVTAQGAARAKRSRAW